MLNIHTSLLLSSKRGLLFLLCKLVARSFVRSIGGTRCLYFSPFLPFHLVFQFVVICERGYSEEQSTRHRTGRSRTERRKRKLSFSFLSSSLSVFCYCLIPRWCTHPTPNQPPSFLFARPRSPLFFFLLLLSLFFSFPSTLTVVHSVSYYCYPPFFFLANEKPPTLQFLFFLSSSSSSSASSSLLPSPLSLILPPKGPQKGRRRSIETRQFICPSSPVLHLPFLFICLFISFGFTLLYFTLSFSLPLFVFLLLSTHLLSPFPVSCSFHHSSFPSLSSVPFITLYLCCHPCYLLPLLQPRVISVTLYSSLIHHPCPPPSLN